MRERARSWIEAFALGVLAALPVVPYLASLARNGVGRYVLHGDYAALELATKFVPTGRTLLGPYSRFGFNHPGPAYFFCLSPIYELSGRSSTALFSGACLLNALAAILLVAGTRLFASRAHAIGAALTVLFWFASFGTAATLPWNPLVVALPLFAFFVLASFFALGRAEAAAPAAALAMFVAQTHLATVPTVAVAFVASIAAYVLSTRKRNEPRRRAPLVAGAAVLVVAMLPPLVEQLSSPVGNMTKLARFFLGPRTEPPKTLATALHAWASGAAWLPQRALERTLVSERDPVVMGSHPLPAELPVAPLVALLVLTAVCIVVAKRRRDHVSVAFLAAGIVTSVTSIVALRGVVGEMFHYLVFWTSSAACIAWLGVVTTASSWLGARWPKAAFAAVVVSAMLSSSVQRAWLATHEIPHRELEGTMRVLYAALRDRVRATGDVPVIHRDAGWYIGLAMLNELTRDGIDARVVDGERYLMGRQLASAEGVTKPLHVYSVTPESPLAVAPCLELLAKSNGAELRVGPAEVIACPPDLH